MENYTMKKEFVEARVLEYLLNVCKMDEESAETALESMQISDGDLPIEVIEKWKRTKTETPKEGVKGEIESESESEVSSRHVILIIAAGILAVGLIIRVVFRKKK